jgi:hypothetical protein
LKRVDAGTFEQSGGIAGFLVENGEHSGPLRPEMTRQSSFFDSSYTLETRNECLRLRSS